MHARADLSIPMTIRTEFSTPLATVKLVNFTFDRPNDDILQDEEAYWLDMCLTPRPRNARACYSGRWSPHDFKRLGDMFFVPPLERLHAKSDGVGQQSSLICQFGERAVRRSIGGDLTWTDRALEACLDIPNAHARWLMARLRDEMQRPGFASEALVEAIVGQLIIELHRYCLSVIEGDAIGGLSPWRIKLIDKRLEELGPPPSLVELAALCGISVRQLTRGFRASRGVSVGEYVMRLRIDRAKNMLRGGDCFKSIAYMLGFSSASSFSYAFRCATGQTPREYRLLEQRHA